MKIVAGLSVTVIASVLISLAACAPRGSSATPKAAPPTATSPVARELEWLFAPAGSAALRDKTIVDQGFDRKYGLKLVPKTTTIGELMAAVIEGRVAVTSMGVGTVAQQFTKGVDIKLIAPSAGSHAGVATWKGSGMRKPGDARGKKIVVPARVTGGYWEQAVAFKMAGLDLETDFSTVVAMDIPLIAGMLEKKEVALAQVWEPMTSRLLVKGVTEMLFTFREKERELFGTPALMAGFAARGEWVRANPEMAKGVKNMIRDAHLYLSQNPDTLDRYKDALGLTNPEEIALVKKALMNTEYHVPEFNPKLMEAQDKWLKLAYELKLLEKPVKFSELIFAIQ